MKTLSRFVVALLATATLFLAGCSGKDTHEKVTEDMMTQMEKMTTVMSSVKDKASAEKAAGELKDIAAEMKKISARAKALGKPSEEKKKELETKFKGRIEGVFGKFIAAGMAISQSRMCARSSQIISCPGRVWTFIAI